MLQRKESAQTVSSSYHCLSPWPVNIKISTLKRSAIGFAEIKHMPYQREAHNTKIDYKIIEQDWILQIL